jgi:hypothetical protein
MTLNPVQSCSAVWPYHLDQPADDSLTVAAVVFLLNIPLVYWRAGVKKFSLQWVLAIHLPVPLVVLIGLNSVLASTL